MKLLHFLLVFALTPLMMSATTPSWRLLIPVQAYTVQINKLDPDKLYIGNWSNQLYRSNDGGKTWEIKEIGTVGPLNYITSVHLSTLDTNVILTGGVQTNGIRRSENGGSTWKQALIDSSGRRQWFVSEAIIEDPKDPNVLYAGRGTNYNSIFRSTNLGRTWDSISVISVDLTTRICTIAIRPDSTNILFAGCKGGIITRSDDSGRSWRRVPVLRGIDSIKFDTEIPKIVFSSRDPQVGYAIATIIAEANISDNGGILKTTDGGATWDRIAYADTSFWAVECRPTPDGLNDDVIIGGFRVDNTDTVIKGDSLVFRSLDGGAMWTQMQNIPWQENEIQDTIRNVWSIRYDSVGKKMYMATFVGLYVLDEVTSVDESVTWTSSTLRTSISDATLQLVDDESSDREQTWALYAMNGNLLMQGAIPPAQGPTSHTLGTVSNLASGQYLLTVGTKERLRTALISIVR